MMRRKLLETTAALAATAVLPGRAGATSGGALHPPARGAIPVAFLISEGATIIDFCGPWEVFQDVSLPGEAEGGFRLYTVAETLKPIRASGGMQIVPDFDFASAPAPKVVVIPAQSGHTAAAKEWIRKSAQGADLTMSVCTGAFLLAKTGLLAGKSAVTHHGFFASFAMAFPDVKLRRGARFVEEGSVATAGGLSSGIDLALRVVQRYYGAEVARKTAYYMEYQGKGWEDAGSNSAYAKAPPWSAEHPICPVCWMEVDPKSKVTSRYRDRTFVFCTPDHKQEFDASPARFADAL